MLQRLHRDFIPWLFRHGWEFKYYYLVALGCLFFLHYFQGQIPEMVRELSLSLDMDAEEAPKTETFLLLALAIIVFRTLSRLFFFYPARVQQKLLRQELVRDIEDAHPHRYAGQNAGQLYQYLYNDLNRLRAFVGFGLLQVGNIIVALYVFLPRVQEFQEGLAVAFLPLFGAVSIFSVVIVFFQPWVKKGIQKQAEVQNFIIESYLGKKTIKNYQSESSFYQKFRALSSDELNSFFYAGLGPALAMPLVKLGFGAALLWGAYLIRANGLGAGALIFFSGFLYLILEPLMFLSWIGVIFTQAIASWNRISGLKKSLTKSDPITEQGELICNTQGDYQFNVVCWNEDLAIKFRKGSWTAISGETGSGKTTLLLKLCSLLKLQEVSLSFVAQLPYIYNDSLKTNLFLGRYFGEVLPEQERAKAIRFLKIFGLFELVTDGSDILDIELGENGKRVSGGQAKRIALIRSLLSGAEVQVWDDPFSSVDFIFEKEILEQIQEDQELKKMTFIFSGHRLSTVRYSDYLYLIGKDRGLLDEGTTQQALSQKGIIENYFNKQLV